MLYADSINIPTKVFNSVISNRYFHLFLVLLTGQLAILSALIFQLTMNVVILYIYLLVQLLKIV